MEIFWNILETFTKVINLALKIENNDHYNFEYKNMMIRDINTLNYTIYVNYNIRNLLLNPIFAFKKVIHS